MKQHDQERIGIIGGTGLESLQGLTITDEKAVSTPWGIPSSSLAEGHLAGVPVVFLARHGSPHRIPPHQVNYRANLWALQEARVTRVIGVNAVGGIHPDMGPSTLVVPDQILDYTWGRGHTMFEGKLAETTHIDFTWPYSGSLRAVLTSAAGQAGLNCVSSGTYAATQGPRLETAAEITRLERDGADLVGMTGMPEAALAAELGMDYASLSLVVNWAAGKTDEAITLDDIRSVLDSGMGDVRAILEQGIPQAAAY